MITQKQLSLNDIFKDCQDKFYNDQPAFLSLLKKHIHLEDFIPITFRNHFYSHTGRPRKYPLEAFLWALIIQRIFSIPTDKLLLTFLYYSKPLREFCGFSKVPDASKITRFKQDFCQDLQQVFDLLVDTTEPICQRIDSSKSEMTIFDSSGIEAFVTENNPKYCNRIIRQLKTYAKVYGFHSSFEPYKAAYHSMPAHASSNPSIKQLFINGHFCYVFKFGIITNGLGIIRHISFYNQEFLNHHKDIVVSKKSDSPEEDKSVHDSKLLIPTLNDFFTKHPLINPKLFLGDAAFDSVSLYKALLTGDTFGKNRHFSKAYIPLNSRSQLETVDYTINEHGIPCCPHDSSLPMKPEGSKSNLRCGLPTFKFVCPKMKWIYNPSTKKSHRSCFCENPCTTSSCGRMIYIYPEKNLRAYPGTVRGTPEWISTYKLRTVVERNIQHIKQNLCLAGRRTQNELTLHSDLILAGITQLITVILSDQLQQHEYLRSLKPLIS
ncbi:Mobile element protein [Lachnospiraceae bacterium TWA4]|nr:Mobile element protein [Lachnospiraceae bacterium TWA4]